MKWRLFAVTREGNLEQLKELVDGCHEDEKKEFLNAVDAYKMTLLHVAAEKGHFPIVAWLLSDDEDGGRIAGFKSVLALNGKRLTALHVAAQEGHNEACLAIVSGCRNDEEREQMLNAVDNSGKTALHFAAAGGHVSVIRWLLSDGRRVGFTGVFARVNFGSTALHLAAERGHLEACQAIVDGCCSNDEEREEMLNAVTEYGKSVLHLAAENGHPTVISWLLSRGEGGGRVVGFRLITLKAHGRLLDLYRRNKDGSLVNPPTLINEGGVDDVYEVEGDSSAFHLAAREGHLEACQALVNGCCSNDDEREEMLNGVDGQRRTALHLACEYRCPPVVQWLLSHATSSLGFRYENVCALTNDRRNALHLAAQRGSLPIIDALVSSCRNAADRLRLLLAVDNNGWTVLHYAAWSSEADAIVFLLRQYPELQTIVDHRDCRGMTVLHRAVIAGIDEESKREWVLVDQNRSKNAVAALLGVWRRTEEGGEQPQVKADPNIGWKVV